MTQRNNKPDERLCAVGVRPTRLLAANVDRPVRNQRQILADQALVRRCIAGEVLAWEELYARFHPLLKNAIEMVLAPAYRNTELVDEIAARVWYALVENDGELLERYDPNRGGRLTTFMQAIARDLVTRHFRSEHRRRGREAIAIQGKLAYCPSDQGPNLCEFLSTLTAKEREFTAQYLLAEKSEACAALSRPRTQASVWQLTRRIRQKLRSYLSTS